MNIRIRRTIVNVAIIMTSTVVTLLALYAMGVAGSGVGLAVGLGIGASMALTRAVDA